MARHNLKGKVLNEADTCARYVVPKLRDSGWDDDPHSFDEQHVFNDGRIFLVGTKVKRKTQKRADFVLRYTRDFVIAVVEAKAEGSPAGEGLRQAKGYAEILGLKFAYSTNGQEIIEKGCNLDIKNPTAKEDLEHLPSEKLVESIVEKERSILEIMGEFKELLSVGVR